MTESFDSRAFRQAGLADAYGTVGNHNLFMQCDSPNMDAFKPLPPVYSFRLCGRDELETWKRLVVEESYVDLVTDYYNKIYAKHEDDFFSRCMFICDETEKPVASCFIWKSYGRVSTVAWFRVLPDYEGLGLGRALLTEILKDADYPVYLHTQTTSARAIKLYSDFGFMLITDPVIGYRTNDVEKSLPYLKQVLPKSDYLNLRFTQANEELLAAALTSAEAEF